MFQQFNLLPGISVLDNVALPLLLRGTGSRERSERARRVIELLSLTDKIGTKARQLSVGQQQRVAIGRALVTGAGVLLCDEPTASLDGATGRGVLDTLQSLARSEDRAVVIVTHDDRVLRVADRVVQVEDGRASVRHGHSWAPSGERS